MTSSASPLSSVSIRRRVWQIVEAAKAGDHARRAFDIFILTLIALNVAAVILQSVAAFERRFAHEFLLFEVASVAVFSLEYLARLWSCVEDPRFERPVAGRLRFVFKPMPIIDLISILPFFLSLGTLDLRVLRSMRLVRLVRIAKGTRYVAAITLFKQVVRSKREELLNTMLMLVLLVMASSLMYFAENEAQPDKFSSIPASMWWAVATLTTVGYGDVYPVTVAGRFAGAVIAILGIGFFALPTAIIGSGFIEAVQERKGPRVCKHCGEAME